MTENEENKEIDRGRKNPACYDDWGGYIGPGADRYGSTQRVTEDGEPLESATGVVDITADVLADIGETVKG
jgi:hypothetical protein